MQAKTENSLAGALATGPLLSLCHSGRSLISPKQRLSLFVILKGSCGRTRQAGAMKDHNYFVYIISNPAKTVLYTGVTNNLEVRLQQHKDNRGKPETFAGKYCCYKLLY
ncbi:GIY-YIG nuclease family protein [Rufibacter sp. XAAS-G3-1]|uniref:GIY-YIG nuclease family protein n=1 Tax=Rufibacter sp. XAAS-G3-1 TaxID=2729134 RepID=UPI00351A3845